MITEQDINGSTRTTTSTVYKPSGTTTSTPLSSQYKAGVDAAKKASAPKVLAAPAPVIFGYGPAGYYYGQYSPYIAPNGVLGTTMTAGNGAGINYGALGIAPTLPAAAAVPAPVGEGGDNQSYGASGYSYTPTEDVNAPSGISAPASTPIEQPKMPAWTELFKKAGPPPSTLAPYYSTKEQPGYSGASGYSYSVQPYNAPGGSGYSVPQSTSWSPTVSTQSTSAAPASIFDPRRGRGKNRNLKTNQLDRQQKAMDLWRKVENSTKPITYPAAPPPPDGGDGGGGNSPFSSYYSGWGGGGGGGGWGGGGGGGPWWNWNLINWNMR